jgi:hypothetical protein
MADLTLNSFCFILSSAYFMPEKFMSELIGVLTILFLSLKNFLYFNTKSLKEF